ncbi:BgTH12-02977 [Blumeria graminis f. sp. triticale]|uniref:Bgt-394 n=3 Tax=Blumeria graminis TaxID=34373 RepID=A0A381LA49_BLUGR|nr:BgTH12-02977 [Blumeria graminis f. sp. triticale]VDB89315.1 Bgt-394 [Blumeria graminis f. sp. tritici]
MEGTPSNKIMAKSIADPKVSTPDFGGDRVEVSREEQNVPSYNYPLHQAVESIGRQAKLSLSLVAEQSGELSNTRSGKSKLNLLNPMSLLTRRKIHPSTAQVSQNTTKNFTRLKGVDQFFELHPEELLVHDFNTIQNSNRFTGRRSPERPQSPKPSSQYNHNRYKDPPSSKSSKDFWDAIECTSQTFESQFSAHDYILPETSASMNNTLVSPQYCLEAGRESSLLSEPSRGEQENPNSYTIMGDPKTKKYSNYDFIQKNCGNIPTYSLNISDNVVSASAQEITRKQEETNVPFEISRIPKKMNSVSSVLGLNIGVVSIEDEKLADRQDIDPKKSGDTEPDEPPEGEQTDNYRQESLLESTSSCDGMLQQPNNNINLENTSVADKVLLENFQKMEIRCKNNSSSESVMIAVDNRKPHYESKYIQDSSSTLYDCTNLANFEEAETLTSYNPEEAGNDLHVNDFESRQQSVGSQKTKNGVYLATFDESFYYDDGLIEIPENLPDETDFDESVFDKKDTDDYGRPLVSLSSPISFPTPRTDLAVKTHTTNEASESCSNFHSTSSASLDLGRQSAEKVSNLILNKKAAGKLSHLTQDSLAAHQSALENAAHTEAIDGGLCHDSENQREKSEIENAYPSSFSNYFQTLPDNSFSSRFELGDSFNEDYCMRDVDYEFDDDLNDDSIIAAANAEALANDCDGFYGREFGFYSAPETPEKDTLNRHGGYFGNGSSQSIDKKGHNGRVATHEPNLTPITERSEYSNRNSYMSQNIHSPSSTREKFGPGLSQFVARKDELDTDMNFESLVKLRRGTWGGSQTSLHSSNGSAGGNDENGIGSQLNFRSYANGRESHNDFQQINSNAVLFRSEDLRERDERDI